MYSDGISRSGDLVDIGVELGAIDKRGSFYYRGEERLAQGRENAKEFLDQNPDLAAEIESQIRQMIGLSSGPPVAADDDTDEEQD
jgi:recombination protein RecA